MLSTSLQGNVSDKYVFRNTSKDRVYIHTNHFHNNLQNKYLKYIGNELWRITINIKWYNNYNSILNIYERFIVFSMYIGSLKSQRV